MRYFIIVFMVLSLIGCNNADNQDPDPKQGSTLSSVTDILDSGPTEGDIYENLLEEERIKVIRIGKGSDLVNHFKGINDAVVDSVDASKKQLNKMGLFRPVISEGTDTTKTCFAYEDDYRGMTFVKIDPLSDLESKDYKKIN
ncbi:hypothetical protein [Fodinibius sp. SL11]|uniref:hypothetical protein n=1 Tax=Fodinibius sp. SL11 TaxID=3425690 RepID=UPI003F882C02